ncbi:MAG TPA: DNRLRE domain-containing protein, partial [Phycisphaerales bacterium]|nr:DNRLRE domain-containing protein [Phycisphaerales bacterium]
MKPTSLAAVLISTGLCIPSVPVRADEITITPSRDVTFNEDTFGDSGNGSGEYLFTGRNAVGSRKRAILFFDIASALPAGATVESVTLTMHCSRTSSGLRSVGLHTALADWGEGASNPPNNEGSGGPAAENDATWIYRFFVPGGQGPTWDTPGGDFLPTASAITSVGGEGQFYSWSSAQMAADVQGWLDDASSNFGWFVVGTETQTRTSKRFDSRTNPDQSFR